MILLFLMFHGQTADANSDPVNVHPCHWKGQTSHIRHFKFNTAPARAKNLGPIL